MQKVIDAHALLSYLNKEPGYEKVEELFTQAAEKDWNLLMTAVNWGEVYYIIRRNYNQEETESIMQLIDTLPIDIIPVDQTLAQQSGIFKATHKLPYADCIAAGLTKLKKAELITGDKDFKALEGEIKIAWL